MEPSTYNDASAAELPLASMLPSLAAYTPSQAAGLEGLTARENRALRLLHPPLPRALP